MEDPAMTSRCRGRISGGYARITACVIWVLVVLLMGVSSVGAQGYRMESDRIVVEGEDWKVWDHPKGVIEWDEEGALHPRFIQKDINACLDASEFGGGLWEAGSNPSDVVNVMDGDMHTFWEPSRGDSLHSWWFVIDLGRLVSATKIVLKFVEEDLGDPFLQFKAGVSDGFSAKLDYGEGLTRSHLSYTTVGRTIEPNERQRVFEFPLAVPIQTGAEQLSGDLVRYIRVQVTDTRGEQREQVSMQVYEALEPDWRGAVEYYRLTETGAERLTTRERYEELSPERRGSVKYYRRELPRLAEVEVWSIGENLSLGILDRGGSIASLHSGSSAPVEGFDGEFRTSQTLHSTDGPVWVVVDLGAVFWVDRVRVLWRKTWVAYGYRLNGSESGDELSWTTVSPEARWDDIRALPVANIRHIAYSSFGMHTYDFDYLEDRFEPVKARFLNLQVQFTGEAPMMPTTMALCEAQIFGEGYVPEIPLTSAVIEVGKLRNLSSVEWVADISSGTSVGVQTRTGDRMDEEKHYYNRAGVEVTTREWNRLPSFFKGPVQIGYVPGSDWSPWSRPYEHSGAPFQSPSPKQYLQIRVKLLSDDPYQAPSLKSLSIPFSTPLTESIRGTMSPREVQRLGASELFTLKIHPLLQAWHPGFNQLLIQTLDRMEVKLVKMEVKKDSLSTDLTDQVKVLPTQPDSLWMVLPDTIQAGEAQEIELQFQSALYQDSTPFNVFVGNTSLPDVWQQVESEDFHPFLHTFIVFVPLDKKMIDNVEIVPSVLTPNGDGVNDVMTIHFTVGRIKAPREVRVTIYDLEGRSVRHMVERREQYPLGKYAMEWDGKDDDGELVDPGMHVVVIRVHSNWEEARNTEVRRRVVVVY